MFFGPLYRVTYHVNNVSFDMVRMPPGRFIDGEEGNRREILISRPFEIGVLPVTQRLWSAVMGSNPSSLRKEGNPVEMVSRNYADEFLGALHQFGLEGFQLPTEAQWAWGARCGAPTFFSGADRAESVAVFLRPQADQRAAGLSCNPTGSFDLSGGVAEWSRDNCLERPASGLDPENSASGRFATLTGGSWRSQKSLVRTSARLCSDVANHRDYYGFRLSRSLI